MKKFLIAGVAAVSLFGASAIAADMPAKAPYRAVAPAAFDWSGFYIGGQAGWQSSRIRLDDPAIAASLVYTPHHDSFAGGAFIGAQRQFGQLVLGLEGSYIAATSRENFGATGVNIFTAGGTSDAHAKLRDIWSGGARLGYAAGTWMPYVTGGFANGAFAFDATNTGGGNNMAAKTRNDGYYIGGGVDWAWVNGWIFGVEYRHYDFSAKTQISTGTSNVPTRLDPRTDTVMARLSYKFGDWGKSPVVAKY